MAFKLKGYSAFTQDTSDMPDVVVTPKIEGIRNDIEKIKKSIAKHSANPSAVKKLREALEQNRNALINITNNK